MKHACISLFAALMVAAAAPALADDVADQRARLANQRIEAEEERRAREEAERLGQAASEAATPAKGAADPATSDTGDDASEVSAERIEMSRALEQLRELGALRDAGYVTEQEFEQLKKKILEAAL